MAPNISKITTAAEYRSLKQGDYVAEMFGAMIQIGRVQSVRNTPQMYDSTAGRRIPAGAYAVIQLASDKELTRIAGVDIVFAIPEHLKDKLDLLADMISRASQDLKETAQRVA